MYIQDLIKADMADLVPTPSSVKLNDIGHVHVRKATLQDEILFKRKYGNRLEKLQEAVVATDMLTICEAFWLLLDKDSKEKLRKVKLENGNGDIVGCDDLDAEWQILLFISSNPYEKSLIINSIGKSFAGEAALEEIPDEKLKKKLMKDLKSLKK